MLGLGDSVGTPRDGVEAAVDVVHGFEELEAHAAVASWTDRAPQRRVHELRARPRAIGAPARHGPRATAPSRCSCGAIGPDGLRLPHTGALDYAAGVPRIPAAAMSSEDADLIERMMTRGEKVVVRLKMEAHTEPDVESANVVGELRGRERPDEVVVVGGHLDSWDVGAGATDDGGGCVVAMGGAAHHEEARAAAAADRARGAVDERGERRTRRNRVPRSASGRARQARRDDRVGQRRVSAARLRRSPAPTRCDRRVAAIASLLAPDRRVRHRRPAAMARTSRRALAKRTSPRCRSKSTARSTSPSTTRRRTPSTRSIPSRWRSALPR